MAASQLCSVEDLGVDEARRFVVDGVAMAVVKDAQGDVFAIGDTCTHGDISLAEGFVEDDSSDGGPDGPTLECWAHGSQFSLRTGKPLTLPAYEPVPVFAVEVRDGFVFVDPAVTVAV